MECPKCHCPMEHSAFSNFEFDRCLGCRGLWIDPIQLQGLISARGAETIDSGDPRVGHRQNAIGSIDCPSCHTRMIRMVDARQPHIWYESCKVCHSIYLDAGEFADLKDHNVIDFVRDLFAPERK